MDREELANRLDAIHKGMVAHRSENAVVRHELADIRRGMVVIAEATFLLTQKVMDMAGRNALLIASAASLVTAATNLSGGTTKLADYKAQGDQVFDKVGVALDSATKAVADASKIIDDLNKQHADENEDSGASNSGTGAGTGIPVTVVGPTTQGERAIPVDFPAGVTVNSGDGVAGPGITAGATVAAGTDTASGVLVMSHPIADAHTGDGSEVLTITPAASPSPAV